MYLLILVVWNIYLDTCTCICRDLCSRFYKLSHVIKIFLDKKNTFSSHGKLEVERNALSNQVDIQNLKDVNYVDIFNLSSLLF